MRRMFADIDADVHVLVDGDDTYDATAAPGMIALLLRDRLDLVNGAHQDELRWCLRPGHRLGEYCASEQDSAAYLPDRISSTCFFGLQGFLAAVREDVPALSDGFELETELTVHALDLQKYHLPRPSFLPGTPAGSQSKLHTIRDGCAS